MVKICNVIPGDTVRVTRPEFKGKSFTALSVMADLVEIEVGNFISKDYIQKKYRNRYIPIYGNYNY